MFEEEREEKGPWTAGTLEGPSLTSQGCSQVQRGMGKEGPAPRGWPQAPSSTKMTADQVWQGSRTAIGAGDTVARPVGISLVVAPSL